MFPSHLLSQNINTDSLEQVVVNLQGIEKINMLSDLCYYLSYSNVEKSEYYGNQCLQLALEHGDSTLIANAYNDLSILYTLKSDYKKGLELNLKAYDIRKRLNNPEKLISSLSKIGVCYSELGEFEKATQYLLEAINILEENELEQKYFQVYDNLGGVFKEMHQYENALKYHSKAYELALNSNNNRSIYTILVNMAGAYRNLGDLDKSLELHLEAEKHIENTNDLRSKALVYSNLASIYSEKHEFDKVLEYSKLSISTYEQIDNQDGLSLINNNLALFYLENNMLSTNNISLIESYLEKAHKHAIICNSLIRLGQNYEAYSQFYIQMKNFEEAMVYMLRSDSINKVLFTLENTKIVEELKTQYESEKKEKELVQNQLQIKQKNYQLIIILGVLLFILLGAFENYRKYKFRRKKMQEEARLKDELTEVKLKNEIQEERLRISRDLHDNIGSQLTFIISSLEMANYSIKKNDLNLVSQKIQEIRNFSASTIEEFRDTIWALNKECICRNDLELKVSSFLSKAKSMVGTIHFDTQFLAKQEINLDSEKGIKAFRIIQESVNNAIKHSEAQNITVSFFDEEEKLVVQIIDDGKGMEMDHLERKNGLNHMKIRANKIGADFEISSQLGKGTQIQLKIDTKEA